MKGQVVATCNHSVKPQAVHLARKFRLRRAAQWQLAVSAPLSSVESGSRTESVRGYARRSLMASPTFSTHRCFPANQAVWLT
jgi:hypothetical protein